MDIHNLKYSVYFVFVFKQLNNVSVIFCNNGLQKSVIIAWKASTPEIYVF